MYNICVYNTETKQYVYLDYIDTPLREQALEDWRRDNPKRSEILNKSDKLKLVAFLEGGGI